MIEVMMEQRQQEPVKEPLPEERMDLTPVAVRDKRAFAKNKEKDEEWMNLPDRI
jgi:hypothetical protein